MFSLALSLFFYLIPFLVYLESNHEIILAASKVRFTGSGKVKVKVTQSCPTLCDPMDYTIHGILKARILEWVAFSFSRGSSQPVDQTQVSRIAGGFFTN